MEGEGPPLAVLVKKKKRTVIEQHIIEVKKNNLILISSTVNIILSNVNILGLKYFSISCEH